MKHMKVKTMIVGKVFQKFDVSGIEKEFNTFAERHNVLSVKVTAYEDEIIYHIFYEDYSVSESKGDSPKPDLAIRVAEIEAQLKRMEAKHYLNNLNNTTEIDQSACAGPTPISVPKNNLVTPTEYNQMMETKKEEVAPETTKNQKRRHGKK